MNELLGWIQENWELIVPLLVALVGLLRAVAHLTPTHKDDELVNRLEAFVLTLIKIFTKRPITTEAKFDQLDAQGQPKPLRPDH